MQQEVEGQTGAVALVRPRQMQRPGLSAQVDARGNHVEMLRLEDHAFGRLNDGQGGMAGEQLHQQAVVGRIEVLDQDEGHATARGQCVQEPPEGVQASG